MKVGPIIPLFNDKCILVSEEDFETAKEIMAEFLSAPIENTSAKKYSLFDKIRMVLEALLLGRFMPGRTKRRDGKNEKIDCTP